MPNRIGLQARWSNDKSIEIGIQAAFVKNIIKGALSGQRQFLATESSLKMMKNAFYFNLKT